MSLSPDQKFIVNEIAKATAEMGEQMRQDQADLNKELQERSYRALLQIRMAKVIDDQDFKALCFLAGHSHSDIDRQIDILQLTIRG